VQTPSASRRTSAQPRLADKGRIRAPSTGIMSTVLPDAPPTAEPFGHAGGATDSTPYLGSGLPEI
jgi:hypothetical protein